MKRIWDEERIRNEIAELDKITGLKGADLMITFTDSKCNIGQFSISFMRFRFSDYWFQNEEWPIESAQNTIRHEYAHYMNYSLYGNRGHGRTWKQCCLIVGALPVRLHDIKMDELYQKRNNEKKEIVAKLSKYEIGRSIIHPKYGKGEIIGFSGDGVNKRVEIIFDESFSKVFSLKWINDNCDE